MTQIDVGLGRRLIEQEDVALSQIRKLTFLNIVNKNCDMQQNSEREVRFEFMSRKHLSILPNAAMSHYWKPK